MKPLCEPERPVPIRYSAAAERPISMPWLPIHDLRALGAAAFRDVLRNEALTYLAAVLQMPALTSLAS
jgi:hypothetical protein